MVPKLRFSPTQDEPASDLEVEDETEQEQSTQSSRECSNMRSPESDPCRKRRSSDYTKTDSSFTSSGPGERRERALVYVLLGVILEI